MISRFFKKTDIFYPFAIIELSIYGLLALYFFIGNTNYFNGIYDKFSDAKSDIAFTDFYGDSERLRYEQYLSNELNSIILFHNYHLTKQTGIDGMVSMGLFEENHGWVLANGYFILTVRPFTLHRHSTSYLIMDSICKKISKEGVRCSSYDNAPDSIQDHTYGKHSIVVYFKEIEKTN